MKDKEKQFNEFQKFAKNEFGVEIIKDDVNGKEYTFEELFGINPNKEKQIEEMAREMCKVCKSIEETCYMKKQPCSLIKDEATALYDLGYRKLPKDSVVLTEREHEIAMRNQYDVGFSFGYKKGSKETAEKIYLQAKAIVYATKHIVQGREYLHIDALKEIIKSCGVEIKE